MIRRIVLLAVAILTIAAFSPTPAATAHTDEEVVAWLTEWEITHSHRGTETEWAETSEGMRAWSIALAQRQDFIDRHDILGVYLSPCPVPEDDCFLLDVSYLPTPEPEPEATASSDSGSSAPSGDTGMGSDVEQWRDLVASYFPADQVDTALRIMACESGGNPNAYNSSSGASGLMQVLSSWADNFGYEPADLFIPSVNMEISYALWLDGGWNHWSCY